VREARNKSRGNAVFCGDIVRRFYNMKSSVKLSAIFLVLLAGCTATHATPKRPWRVEVTTSGGITGRGTGDYAIDSGGKVTARLSDGRACTFTADAARIEALLAKARPAEWKESYFPENPCCDRFEYTLTYDEAGAKTATKWVDDPLPMPADLVALSQAIVGGDATSLRMLAAEQCR
jgi:hypothetical protein